MSEEEVPGAAVVRANVSQVRTDGRTGAFKVTLDIFESESLKMPAILALYLKNVEVALVPLPEED